ncbi:MAG: PAS domain-containing protein, partial [Gallionellaceae bacterium]|nr:PAS domain-containing protein [Gallionellaceae bacterium]
PLLAEQGCLKCHGFQGYKEGDVRGGVSTSVYLEPYLVRERDLKLTLALMHGAIWLIGLGGVGFSYRRERRLAAQREQAERELRESEQKYHMVADYTADWEYWIGLKGEIVYTSPSCKEITGYDVDEFMADPYLLVSMVHADDRSAFQAHANTHVEQAAQGDIEFRIVRKDGEIHWISHYCRPVFDQQGHWRGSRASNRDITERKNAGVLLRQSREALKEAQRIARLGSWHLILATNEVFWSEELYRMYGFDPALPPPLYTESMKLFTPESWERLSNAITHAAETGSPYELELEMAPRDGGMRWMWARGELVRDEYGAPVEVRGVAMDITERKQAEEELRRSEHGLAEAQRIAHLGSWELDLLSNVLHWSGEIYRIFEIDPVKFGASYEAFLNAIHPDDREMVNKAYADSLATRMPYDIVHRLQMKDGRIKYVNERCETYYGADGKPLRSVGTVHDITERKLDEEALLRLNRELHAISNCNQTLMRAEDEQSLLDEICRIVCDDAGYRMTWVGYPENDEAKTIRPVAWAGVEGGYLQEAHLTWADTEHGRGPSGTAIRTGVSVGIADFSTDPRAVPWREAALQRGFRSSISLPLKDENGKTFGIFNIYADKPEAFTPEEVRLLEELAGDLAFGIKVLRARIERKQAE